MLVIMQNCDGVAVSNGNDFGWPGKAGGRYGKQEQEKDEAGIVGHRAVHSDLPSLVKLVPQVLLLQQDQESNLGKITYSFVINKQYHRDD